MYSLICLHWSRGVQRISRLKTNKNIVSRARCKVLHLSKLTYIRNHFVLTLVVVGQLGPFYLNQITRTAWLSGGFQHYKWMHDYATLILQNSAFKFSDFCVELSICNCSEHENKSGTFFVRTVNNRGSRQPSVYQRSCRASLRSRFIWGWWQQLCAFLQLNAKGTWRQRYKRNSSVFGWSCRVTNKPQRIAGRKRCSKLTFFYIHLHLIFLCS